MSPKNELPTPEMLLVEAKGTLERDAPIDLYDYADVIGQLREKNYSYGKIAEWLGERLGRPINKGVVFRIYEEWKAHQEQEAAYANLDEDDIPPPGEGNEIADAIHELEERVREFVDDYVASARLPEFVADEAILRVAQKITQEQNDERAANEADAATEKQTKEGGS